MLFCTSSHLLFGDGWYLDEDPVPGWEVEVGRSGDDEVGHFWRQNESLEVKVAICSTSVKFLMGLIKYSLETSPVNSNLGCESSFPVPLLSQLSASRAVWLAWTQQKQEMSFLNLNFNLQAWSQVIKLI